jgi:hypothetical protein
MPRALTNRFFAMKTLSASPAMKTGNYQGKRQFALTGVSTLPAITVLEALSRSMNSPAVPYMPPTIPTPQGSPQQFAPSQLNYEQQYLYEYFMGRR